MIKRTAAVLLLLVALVGGMTPAADATVIFSGECSLILQFSFGSPVKAGTTSPTYGVDIVGGLVDHAPLGWSGVQQCAIEPDALQPARETSGGGSGTSTVWSCEAVLSSGGWGQSFTDEEGSTNPASVNGTHRLFGTWDAWTLVVTGPNFTGVAELTLAPFENLKAADCAGGGISELTMDGVMVFEDPEL